MGSRSKDPNKAAMKIQKEQMERLRDIPLPELEELALESPELVGLLQAEELDPSAMEEISLDPEVRDMQMQALQGLKERSETGLTEDDKMALEGLLEQNAAQENAASKRLMQQFDERGMADSGQALMAQLQSQQSSANRGRQQARELAQQARLERQQALQNMGNAATNVRRQDFGEREAVATARDRIAAANSTRTRTSRHSRNYCWWYCRSKDWWFSRNWYWCGSRRRGW